MQCPDSLQAHSPSHRLVSSRACPFPCVPPYHPLFTFTYRMSPGRLQSAPLALATSLLVRVVDYLFYLDVPFWKTFHMSNQSGPFHLSDKRVESRYLSTGLITKFQSLTCLQHKSTRQEMDMRYLKRDYLSLPTR